jgi:hypothetical protein
MFVVYEMCVKKIYFFKLGRLSKSKKKDVRSLRRRSNPQAKSLCFMFVTQAL